MSASLSNTDDRTHQTTPSPLSQHKASKRTSKACLVCRARKSKCTLDAADGAPQPPCQRCKKEGRECIIGSSNRGGKRIRRSTLSQAPARTGQPPTWSGDLDDSTLAFTPSSATNQDVSTHIDPALNQVQDSSLLEVPRHDTQPLDSRSSSDETVPFNDLQNPSDALDILAQIASNDDRAHRQTSWHQRQITEPSQHHRRSNDLHNSSFGGDLDYHLIRVGAITSSRLCQLVQRYHIHYHPYFPLVPPATLNVDNIATTVRDEPHLLTAILAVASRDLDDDPQIFTACTEYMQTMVSALAAGGPGGVEAVEALLLLAEWTPYTSRAKAGLVGRGEEDREAWMHVGNALRIGYFLGLDRYSFRVPESATKDPQWRRKRLVWTACYISDRQISIRIGKAFWSRGPGPMTTLRKDDFPSLQPQSPGAEDYASIFQATLELTLLFSNVHDVLYSNPSSVRTHLTGGYIKFIDDFRSAIYGWNSVYGTLTCSPNLKATLLMSYDYLRLYTNAFAFHATIQRALPKSTDGKATFSRVFYNNVGAVGDARFIYEGLDAAKSLLTTMNNFVDAEKSLRYMPLRFYLFTIYAGVFLYRARAVGVMSPEEESSVKRMIQQTVQKLQQASVGEQHPGTRYSQLLRLLWDKVDRKSQKEVRNVATLENPYRPGSSIEQVPDSISAHSATQESPATTEQMGDFSWTDLDAIGNFALNGNDGGSAGADLWSGFLPTDNILFGEYLGQMTMDDWALTL